MTDAVPADLPTVTPADVADVVVVGAGLAGLTAARRLATSGRSVIVIDKGVSVGGRLATRRIGTAVLDHGAQFFTVRSAEFAAQVDRWVADGVVDVWCHGFGTADGHPRYRARTGMNALAKSLVTDDVDLRLGQMVFAVERPDADTLSGTDASWTVVIDDGTRHHARSVVITSPLPQTFGLLIDSGIDLPEDLISTGYDPTVALLAVLDRPSGITDALTADRLHGSPFSFVGDNHSKGISPLPAVTFHADTAWSREHFEDDPAAIAATLTAAATPFIGGARILEHQVKKWRFATPARLWPERYWATDGVVLAGDVFAGPGGSNVEAAYLSGRAAAGYLLGEYPLD